MDTVIGEKTDDDPVLMTLVERKTRNAIVHKIPSKTAEAVMDELKTICSYFSEKFSTVFKTITGDNGSEFVDLFTIESLGTSLFFI